MKKSKVNELRVKIALGLSFDDNVRPDVANETNRLFLGRNLSHLM